LAVVGTLWWCYPATPAHFPSHDGQQPLEQGVEWGVHNSYARDPITWFGNRPRPSLHEQYARGVRLYEIDAYWWFRQQWLVAHVPIVDQSAHVHTVKEAVCALRKLGADNTMLLDMKNVAWSSCGASAMRAMVSHLQACHTAGLLTVLVDVSCTSYNNIDCARALRNVTLPNTRLLFRGIDFWWLWLDCGSSNTTTRGASCDEFTEPRMGGRAPVPILAECHHCTRDACGAAVRAYHAPVTYLQVS
jgi:hypothetical protein